MGEAPRWGPGRRSRHWLLALTDGLYGVLLWSFPAGFRREYGRDARAAFHDRAADVLRRRGAWWVTVVCLSAAPRTVVEGVAERCEGWLRGRDGVTGVRRGRRSRGVLEMMWTEVRHALRGLWSSPRYTLAVVLTFALGVGTNAAVYGALRGILLRPLAVRDPERIVVIGESPAEGEPARGSTSRYALDLLSRESHTLEDVAAFGYWEGVLTGAGDAVRLRGAMVAPGYFRVLGRTPLLGRIFTPEEGTQKAAPVVMISARLWHSRFGGDRGVIGRTIQLDGKPFQVVGVLPPDMETPDRFTVMRSAPDLWVAFQPAEVGSPGNKVVRGIARMAPGVSRSQVSTELKALAPGLAEQEPRYAPYRLGAVSIDQLAKADLRLPLLLLQGAVLLVLLIGCVNVMNLTLARGVERRRTMAVRIALGAGRGVLLRGMLAEVLLAALGGAAVGLILARLGLHTLLRLAPANLLQIDHVALDGGTALAALGLTLVAGLFAGAVPASRLLSARALAGLVHGGLRSTVGPGHRRLQSGLGVIQLALAVALLVGAGLLLRSFRSLLGVDLGYDPDGVRVLQIDLPQSRYDGLESRMTVLRRIQQGLEGQPEVARAGFTTAAPQYDLNNFAATVGIVGRPPAQDENERPGAYIRAVTPGYARAVGMRVLRGRFLAAGDGAPDGGAHAAVVNREFQRRFFRGGSALGSRLTIFGDTLEVVGIVADTRYSWLGDDAVPELYLPYYGRFSTIILVARGSHGAGPLAPVMRRVVQAVDPLIPVNNAPTLWELVDKRVAAFRFTMLLLSVLSLFALAIAAVGIYGVLSFRVARRRTEIGVRMALGAQATGVLAMVLREAGALAVGGSLIGLALAWAGGRLLQSMVFGVTTHDPVVFLGVALLLTAVALTASWLPALRAARLDPAVTLRDG